MFFCFDGVDGVGKSTQVKLFVHWLESQGHAVVTCRDPGSTELGEAVRKILLGHHETPIHRRSEMLLYMAARAQLVEEVIRPALDAGEIVVSDRFLLANVVYQGIAGELGETDVWNVGEVATDRIQPDRIFLLDMPAARASERFDRQLDRMEAQGLTYLEQVRQGYLQQATRFPQQIVVVNADQSVEAIQAEIQASASQRI